MPNLSGMVALTRPISVQNPQNVKLIGSYKCVHSIKIDLTILPIKECILLFRICSSFPFTYIECELVLCGKFPEKNR